MVFANRLAARIEFGDDVMGIFDALNTSVAGLQAQSFALQNISGNIANAQTTGYKGTGTSFVDLVPDSTTPDRQVAGSVTACARSTIASQETVWACTVATYMAINGDGFFSVQKASGITDNVPVFTGVTDYTRRGDFQVNANGNLVNGAGYYLMGVAVDPKTGNPLGNVPQVLQFQNNFIPAQTTTSINYAANLPSTPTTATSATSAAGTINALGGLNALDFTGNPLTTAATGYTDATTTGTAVSNQAGPTITTNTKLSGASGDVLTAGFAAGDTITIDSTTYTFVNTGSTAGTTGTNIDISDTVGTLLNKISAVTGVAPVLTPGATTGTITLHTGTAADLSISATPSPGTGANALAALGFAGGATKLRTTFTSPPTGAVTANDQQTFLNESVSGGAVTAYDQTGTAVNLPLRWAKIANAALAGS